MKQVSMLCCLTIFSVLFLSCKKKCEAFDEKRAMFIPTNMALNDSIIFYSNYGDSVTFYFDSKTMSKPEEYSACDKCSCAPTLDINFHSKDNIQRYMSYSFDDPESVNEIYFQVNYNYGGIYAYASFKYNPANNPVTASKPIEESVLVNGVYYKDVVILTANMRFDKVYVAKDMGVIMATIKNSDVVWTINRPQ